MSVSCYYLVSYIPLGFSSPIYKTELSKQKTKVLSCSDILGSYYNPIPACLGSVISVPEYTPSLWLSASQAAALFPACLQHPEQCLWSAETKALFFELS